MVVFVMLLYLSISLTLIVIFGYITHILDLSCIILPVMDNWS